jgi:hypothetical protein
MGLRGWSGKTEGGDSESVEVGERIAEDGDVALQRGGGVGEF